MRSRLFVLSMNLRASALRVRRRTIAPAWRRRARLSQAEATHLLRAIAARLDRPARASHPSIQPRALRHLVPPPNLLRARAEVGHPSATSQAPKVRPAASAKTISKARTAKAHLPKCRLERSHTRSTAPLAKAGPSPAMARQGRPARSRLVSRSQRGGAGNAASTGLCRRPTALRAYPQSRLREAL